MARPEDRSRPRTPTRKRPKEAAKRRSLTEFLRFPKDSLPLADDTEEDAFSERAWKDRLLRILVGTNSLRLAPLFSLGFRSSPKSTVKDSAGLLLISAAAARPPASPSRSAERSRAESAGDRDQAVLGDGGGEAPGRRGALVAP